MAIPNISLRNEDGTGALSLVNFDPRPLGGTSNAIEASIWNDQAQPVIGESVGTGDGSTATFALAHGNVLSAAGFSVMIDGEELSSTYYTIDATSGEFTIASGYIPTAGQNVTASYSYTGGAGTASAVFCLSRKHYSTTITGDSVTLPTAGTRLYEVSVDGVIVSDVQLSWDGAEISFSDPPEAGTIVDICYEDEACSKQVLQVKSSGVFDPYSQGIVDDALSSFVGIGGSIEIEDESVGTGDGNTLVFTLASPCVQSIESITVGGNSLSVGDYILDPVRGEIELATPPAVGEAVSVSYVAYRALSLGAIPPACGRKIQLRGHAPTTAIISKAEASLEVWAV